MVAYVGADGESLHHQTVMVYDGHRARRAGRRHDAPRRDGRRRHRVDFRWRPESAGIHTLYVKLLGHVAAGEDDLLTIPLVARPGPAGAPNGFIAAVAQPLVSGRGTSS